MRGALAWSWATRSVEARSICGFDRITASTRLPTPPDRLGIRTRPRDTWITEAVLRGAYSRMAHAHVVWLFDSRSTRQRGAASVRAPTSSAGCRWRSPCTSTDHLPAVVDMARWAGDRAVGLVGYFGGTVAARTRVRCSGRGRGAHLSSATRHLQNSTRLCHSRPRRFATNDNSRNLIVDGPAFVRRGPEHKQHQRGPTSAIHGMVRMELRLRAVDRSSRAPRSGVGRERVAQGPNGKLSKAALVSR